MPNNASSSDSGSNDIELANRVERERIAHEEDDVLAEHLRIKSRFPHIQLYPSKVRLVARMDEIAEHASGKRLLDYGCGRGITSLKYLQHGAIVHGIDISAPYVKEARTRAIDAGFSEDKFSFRVMDAHKLEYEDDYFDLVIGIGILHHLDPDVAMKEIHRVLKPGGRVSIIEPLADNPLLKVFRILTPKTRTEDEAPFTGKDVERLCSRDTWHTELVFCGLLNLPLAMVTSVLTPRHADNPLRRLFDRIERWTHEKELLLSWNQYILFNMVKK